MIKANNIPEKWEVKKISDVLFFQEGPGVRKWQFHDTGVKLLNVGNINNGEIDLNKTKIHLSEEEAYGKYSHFLIDEGDLLIACSGIIVSNFHNKIAFIKKKHLPLCLNTSTMRFKELDKKIIDLNYFRYFLQTNHFTSQLRKFITGSAQLNFGPSHIKKIYLFLPPLPEQKKIAKILDVADSLRQKDQQLIDHYNRLSQSLFLDMFGDPVTNPMGWEMMSIENLSSNDCPLTYGIVQPGDECDDGVAVVRPVDLTTKYIPLVKLKKIAPDISNKFQRTLLKGGEILLSVRGSVGVVSIALPELCGANVTRGIVPIWMDESKMTNDFAFTLFQTDGIQSIIKRLAKGATLIQINLKDLREMKTICPPIKLQTQFSQHIQAIEQQKHLAQASLEKSNDLFNSLLQSAFKGELRKF